MAVVQNYLPGDPLLIDKIVYELKSQGIFDQFRKECIADVDTKPAYQNLRQRVEGSVSGFLNKQRWSSDMNKNQVREMLRKNIYESGFLETGVERIVDQVVNPKMNSVFLPKVTEVVYKFLGIENHSDEMKINEKQSFMSDTLLPTDLEAVSPESEKRFDMSNDSQTMNDSKIDEDESPPFEPLEEKPVYNMPLEENSVDSHLSGFSGLMSHDSNHSQEPSKTNIHHQMEISNQDSTLSKQSSEGRLSIVMSDDNDTKMEICDDSQMAKSSQKTNEIKQKTFDFEVTTNNVSTKKSENKTEEKSKSERSEKTDKSEKSSRSYDKHKSRHDSRSEKKEDRDKDKDKDKERKSDKDKKEHKDKYSSRDKGKERDRKDSKSGSGSRSEKDAKSDRDKTKSSSSSSSKHNSGSSSKDKDRDKDKDKERTSSSRKESSSKDRTDNKERDKSKSSSSSSKDKDLKHKEDKGGKGDSKSTSSKHDSKSDKHRKDEKHKSDRHSSSSSSKNRDKDKKDSKKDKKENKDDHFSSKKRSDRRSTDRDSNDGHSGLKSSSSSFDSYSSSQTQSKGQESSNSNSNNGSGDSGNSDALEGTIFRGEETMNIQDAIATVPTLKLIKPKFASNIHEAKRLMKIRKKLNLLEKQRNLDLTEMITKKIMENNKMNSVEEKRNKINNVKEKKKHNNIIQTSPIRPKKEPTPEPPSPLLKSSVVSAATWDALEAKLHQSINYSTDYDDIDGADEVVEELVTYNKDDCLYLNSGSNERIERYRKFSRKYIYNLENRIDGQSSTHDAPSKVKNEQYNHTNHVNQSVKRKFTDYNSDVKNNNSNKRFNTHHIEVHENFSLPLSPAESDNSIDKKSDMSDSSDKALKKSDTDLGIKKSNRVSSNNQRYSSDDLYKPRPVFRGSRRRNGRSLGVD